MSDVQHSSFALQGTMNDTVANSPDDRFMNFLRTGKLHVVELGTPVSVVRKVLGPPSDNELARRDNVLAYASQSLQIGVFKGRVYHVGVYFHDADGPPQLPEQLLTQIPFTGSTAEEQVAQYLERNQIPWVKDKVLWLESQHNYLVAKAVEVVFLAGRLTSMHVHDGVRARSD